MHARSAFFAIVYGKHTDWLTWGIGHMNERTRQVEHRADLLRKGHKLTEEHVGIIKSELPGKLKKVGAFVLFPSSLDTWLPPDRQRCEFWLVCFGLLWCTA